MNQSQIIPLLIVATGLLLATARILGIPLTLVLVGGGILIGLAPGLPPIVIEPAIVFGVILPPLLYASTFFASTRLLRATIGTSLLPSLALIALTTALVTLTTRALIPGLSLGAAAVFGLIASAVDTNSFVEASRVLRVSRRYTDRLKVEQMVGPVILLSVGVLAVTATVTETSVSIPQALVRILIELTGGGLVGMVVAHVFLAIRRRLHIPLLDIAVSLSIPYSASLSASLLGVSTILAVLVAGFYVAIRYIASRRQTDRASAETRLLADAFWNELRLLLAGSLLVLIGLGLPGALRRLSNTEPLPTLVVWAGVIYLATLSARFVIQLGVAWFARDQVTSSRSRPLTEATLMTWAGMRSVTGVVIVLIIPPTLASGALFPGRDTLIVLTCLVILISALLQGLTMPWVIRRLGFAGDSGAWAEEQTARAAAAHAALARLDAYQPTSEVDQAFVRQLRAAYERRLGQTDNAPMWRNLAQLREATLTIERETFSQRHEQGLLGDDAYVRLQHELDLEAERVRVLASP